jgi:cell division protein ZapB
MNSFTTTAVKFMDTDIARQQTERYFTALEEQLEQLIFVCDQLATENQALQTQYNELLIERDELMAQNEQARMRIEAMVSRLKGLGHSL